MNQVYLLYELVRADFLERARRYGTLIVIGLTIYFTYLYLPPLDASYLTFSMGGYRGIYNSAWVAGIVTVFCVVFMSFVGFYLVKNAVERDRLTGVGQIIATTPLSRWQYTLGKMFSNLCYLAAMAGVAMLAAVAIQLWRAEDLRINLFDYLATFVFVILPWMALVASLAVLFECIPWLRGSFGNVLFFFLYLVGLITLAALFSAAQNALVNGGDAAMGVALEPTGTLGIFCSMVLAGMQQVPGVRGGLVMGAADTAYYGGAKTFVWDGVAWTGPLILGRLLWLCLAVGIAGVAALFFDRFDPSQEKPRRKGLETGGTAGGETIPAPVPAPPSTSIRLTQLVYRKRASEFDLVGRLVLSELRLMLKGLRWWWYLLALALVVGALFVPLEYLRQFWLPLAWVFPVIVWSQLGSREVRYRAGQLIFSTAHPLRRQFPAAWFAGALVALAFASTVGARLVLTGQWYALAALVVGATFIPSLALALGVWSGSSKLFEVLYLVWWYVGPMNRVPILDFLGASDQALTANIPLLYAGLAILLLALALIGRRRQFEFWV